MVDRETMICMVTALQKGDQTAAELIYDTFYDDTYYFIKSTVLDPELAADLTQDTFVEVLEKINTLHEPAAFVSWLRRIAYNKSVNYFKKSKADTVSEDEDGNSVFDTLEEDRTEFIPDKALDQEDFKATILSMLQALPETQRSALVLHYYEERSVQEIADIQGVSQGTVKSRLNYGRNAIKQSVETYEKKNGIKLHCVGVAPILLWLFSQGVLVRDGAVICGGFASITATIGAGSHAAVTATAAAAKTAITTKLIAAVAAAAVVISGAAIGISQLHKQNNNKNQSQQIQDDDINTPGNSSSIDSIEDNSSTDSITKVVYHNQVKWDETFRKEHLPKVVSINFTNVSIPEGVEVIDISEKQDNSVLMWKEETTNYNEENWVYYPHFEECYSYDPPFYNMYVTTSDGNPVVLPEDCRHMFAFIKYRDNRVPDNQMVANTILQNINFSNIDTSHVKIMSHMFSDCTALANLDLSNIDTSNAETMASMFANCYSLQTINISNFNTTNVTDMAGMFHQAFNLISLDLSSFDTSHVTNMRGMFQSCFSLQYVDVSSFNTSNVENMDFMFNQSSYIMMLDVSNFDTSNVTTMEEMFRLCSSINYLDVSGFDTSKVTKMNGMFSGCSGLQELDVSNFNTSQVTNMNYMFSGCQKIQSLDVSNFDTSLVTTMRDMFGECNSLKYLDVSKFNTSNVVDMWGMFSGCISLQSLDVSNFITSKVTDMGAMFYKCESLDTLDVSNFDTSLVTDMRLIFGGKTRHLKNIVDISNWKIPEGTTEEDIFYLSEY